MEGECFAPKYQCRLLIFFLIIEALFLNPTCTPSQNFNVFTSQSFNVCTSQNRTSMSLPLKAPMSVPLKASMSLPPKVCLLCLYYAMSIVAGVFL
jgi:hypothetical protein